MNHEKLLVLLTSQLENLDELLATVKYQQESLVTNNVSGIDEAAKKEELMFSRINSQQKLIINEIVEINEIEQLGMKDFRLTALIKVFPKAQTKELKKLLYAQKQVVMLIKEINRINFQNSFLIDHSRELIKNIITNVANLSRSPGQNKNVLFDRRA